MVDIRIVTTIFSILIITNNSFCQINEHSINIPKSIKELDGAWTWDWGTGKTAFILKNGKVDNLPITFKLDGEILHEKNSDVSYVDLAMQADGSWKGVEFPSGSTVVLKKVDLKKLTIPKSKKDLDGEWVWNGSGAPILFEIKDGRWVGPRKIRLKLKNHVLRVILQDVGKDYYADLILQPDGSWIGIETPTELKIQIKRVKKSS